MSHRDNTDEEKDKLTNRLKDLEEIIKNLKTANKQKDFDLVTKEKTIEKKETESKYLKDENILLNKKIDNLDKVKNESEICCQVC